jgi:hypothetical protein
MELRARFLAVATAAILAVSAGTAHADLIGDTIHVLYLFPDQGTIYQDLGSFMAPGGGTINSLSYFVTGSQITISIPIDTLFQTGSFNGFEFDVVSGTPLIDNVSLDPGSTLLGGIVSFTASSVLWNFAGLATEPGQQVTYDLTFGGEPSEVTPEPSSLILLGIGLLGAVGVIRRESFRA